MSCIFCKIVNREVPSYIVYEDDISIAFLDINPLSKGHILFIPKKHYTKISEIPDEELEKLVKSFKKLLKVVEERISKNYNIINNCGKLAGQEIEHVHIHIVPRYGDEKIFLWITHKLTEDEAKEVLERLR